MSEQIEQKDKEQDQDSYWQKVRDFNLSRTPFWVSFLLELAETVIPFIAIWLIVGPDFQHKAFSLYNHLPDIKDGYVALICVCYLIWAMGIATITYFLKWQKADTFTYTLSLAILGFTIIMLGCWMVNWNTNSGAKVIVRFVICIFALIPSMFVGVIATTFARNNQFKIEEEDERILIAYKNGEQVPTKQQLRIERAEQARIQREKDLQELEDFKNSLDKRIEEKSEIKHEEKVIKKSLSKEEKRQLKLDQKEERKRFKAESRANKHKNDKEISGLD